MEPFIGEIRLFSGDYTPFGWALCNGQLLSIQDHAALFAVLGTTYGGDGRSTFGLPDLQARAPVGQGASPGLSTRLMGEKGGVATVTLTSSEMPEHAHAVNCQTQSNQTTSASAIWANQAGRVPRPTYADAIDCTMNEGVINAAGGGKPHSNLQPYLALNFIIALQGNFPVKP